jgi:uncharacterized membrane protein HdeD (DUF308 family)
MTKSGTQKIFAGLLIAVGIVLLVMYLVLRTNKGSASSGMFIVGIVDVVVGALLLRRATSQGRTS